MLGYVRFSLFSLTFGSKIVRTTAGKFQLGVLISVISSTSSVFQYGAKAAHSWVHSKVAFLFYIFDFREVLSFPSKNIFEFESSNLRIRRILS